MLLLHSAAQAQSPFSGSISPFIGFDSNAGLATDNDFGIDSDSMSGGVLFGARYRIHRSSRSALHATVDGFTVFHADADAFDVTGLTPSLKLTRRLQIGERPATFQGSVGLQWVDVADSPTNSAQSVFASGGISVRLSPITSINGTLKVSTIDFDGEGFDPATTSRDATRIEPTVGVAFTIPTSQTTLNAQASASINDADGENNNYNAFRLMLGVSQPWQTRLGLLVTRAGVTYGKRSHDDFTTLPRREQDILQLNVGLLWRVTERLSTNGSVSFVDSDANRDDFSYDRSRASLGLTWSF